MRGRSSNGRFRSIQPAAPSRTLRRWNTTRVASPRPRARMSRPRRSTRGTTASGGIWPSPTGARASGRRSSMRTVPRSTSPSRSASAIRATACWLRSWPTATLSSATSPERDACSPTRRSWRRTTTRWPALRRRSTRTSAIETPRSPRSASPLRGDTRERRWNGYRRSRSCALIPATRRSSRVRRRASRRQGGSSRATRD